MGVGTLHDRSLHSLKQVALNAILLKQPSGKRGDSS
jgi:hypothetical protein